MKQLLNVKEEGSSHMILVMLLEVLVRAKGGREGGELLSSYH